MKDNVMIFNIKEIAEGKIEIPVFQRGLVWKPKQIELLWDSILRGFPIGSFTLSESDTSNSSGKNSLYLMDGQQRYNSIGIGFDDSVWRTDKEKKNEPTTVLWLDIENDNKTNSSRKFWIRATTKYHPWGYENNDECSTLSASNKREAMKSFGLKDRNIYKQHIFLSETWPYKADFPIPLYLFLNSDFTSEEAFLNKIIKEIEEKAPRKWNEMIWEKKDLESAKSEIRKLFKIFKKVQDYSVSGTLLSDEVIEKETKEDKEVSTDLEILFNRLGTGGIQITQSDLIYSAITAYWGEIKDNNEKLAENHMPPASLVTLVFRLVLTKPSNNNLASSPTISRIRNLRNNSDFRKEIENFYEIKLLEVLTIVDKMISGNDNDKTPAILKLDIYKNHPDLMLLLMYLANKKLKPDYEFMRAFVFYVLWFGKNEKEIVEAVFKQINNADLNIKDSIMKAMFECVYQEYIIPIPNLNTLFINENLSEQAEKVYDILIRNHNVLLFTQRVFLNNTFPLYNPVTSFDWEQHNRPWDFDHIIPQSWVKGKRGPFLERCKQFNWTIANQAAIPFENNREKNAYQNWDYYNKNKDDLFFQQEWIEGIDSSITTNEDMTNKFIEFCKKRMNLIFDNCNEALFKHINLDVELSSENINLIPEKALKRKNFFENLRKDEKLRDFKLYYVDEDNLTDVEIERTKVIDWSRKWISLGYNTNGLMISITSNDGNTYEIGLRKQPEDSRTRDDVFEQNNELIKKIESKGLSDSNEWWYKEKDLVELTEEKVKEEFLKFVEDCNIEK